MLWEGAGVETLDVLGHNELSPLYWEENGGITFRDPDGRGVIYASWIYGRDRQPSESPQ